MLHPTTTDDRGNRNNVITVVAADKGGKKANDDRGPPKPKQRAKSKQQEEVEAQEPGPEAEEAEVEEEKPQPQQGKKGKGQQQQKQQQGKKGKGQQQQQQQGKKKEKGPAVAESQKLISTVKSYNALWFVGDVECGDEVEDVLKTAALFHEALPDNGVLIFSAGLKSFIAAAVVPEAKTSSLTAIEWVQTALTVVAEAKPPEGTDTLAHSVVDADPDKGIFPLKLKDLGRGPVFQMLRKRKLVKEEESDDEMFFLDE